jgi:hypothetical protein
MTPRAVSRVDGSSDEDAAVRAAPLAKAADSFEASHR